MQIAVQFVWLGLLLWDASCMSLRPRDNHGPRVVQIPLQRRDIENPVAHDRLRRRKDTVGVTLDNLETLYFFNASLGTPEQSLRLHLDTGSSDLWVNSRNSALCSGPRGICDQSGTYSANASSTYEYLNSNFNISYVDGSSASGDYATDTFHMGDLDIDNFQFGIGYSSSSEQGVLGIGYPSNEVQVARYGRDPYKNLPARMVSDGYVDSNVYSIWLDDIDSSTGSLLFGGIDKAQYNGDLTTLPLQKGGSTYREFYVTMTGFGLDDQTIQDDMALAVLLDTGSSLTYLPNDLVKSVYQEINATWSSEEEVAFVSCDVPQRHSTVTFAFSNPASITVDMSELLFNVTSIQGKPYMLPDGSRACLFGLAPSGNGVNVLGDTFLRSAYVVYDINNNQVSLAQSNFDPKGSDVVEIGSGKDSVPGATPAPDPVAAESGLPYFQEKDDDDSAASSHLPSWALCISASTVTVAYSLWGGMF